MMKGISRIFVKNNYCNITKKITQNFARNLSRSFDENLMS
jgi:hypothetical protein